MAKIVIAGTRTFTNFKLLTSECDKLFLNEENPKIICGHADGADTLGATYAEVNNYEIISYPVTKEDWVKHGKAAGILRNKKMADDADRAIVFWDGKSPGSKNMIYEMLSRNKSVNVVFY